MRHTVLSLTVLAYMITYMDRVVMSAALPVIQKELGLSLITASSFVAAFRWGYALFQLPGGWLGDRIGPRRALSLIVVWWSIFTSATALAWNTASMIVFRFLFGAGEAGAFPIATRSLSRWMLPSERGIAQGVTHAGSRLGAAITPPIVVYLILSYGWRATFVMFGLLGIAWAALWYWYYRDTPDQHTHVSASEIALIHSSIGGTRTATTRNIPWARILGSSTLWQLCVMYACYGYCISVYLDWFPKYLNAHRHYDLKTMGFYASLPLMAGVFGDLAGGYVSDRWLVRTGNLKTARRWVGFAGFLIAAAGMMPATLTSDPFESVVFSCLAVFGLELTVGVSWAIPLDIGGDYAGSASAVMNTCGNIGGAISPTLLALTVESYGWEMPFFVTTVLCLIGALLYLKIDATQRIFAEAK